VPEVRAEQLPPHVTTVQRATRQKDASKAIAKFRAAVTPMGISTGWSHSSASIACLEGCDTLDAAEAGTLREAGPVDLDAQSSVTLLALGRPSGVEPGGKYRPLLQLDLMRRLSAELGRRRQHAAEAHDQLP